MPPLSPLSSLPSTPGVSRSSSPVPFVNPTHVIVSANTDNPSPILASSASTPSTTSNAKKRKNACNKQKSKANKKHRRQEEGGKLTAEENPAPASSVGKHVIDAPNIDAAFAFKNDVDVSSTAYVGYREGGLYDSEGYWLNDLVGPDSEFGFQEVQWDGRTTTPIVDKNGVVFALLAGQPDNDPTWDTCISAAAKTLSKERSKCRFMEKQISHRRGEYPALTTGISYGGGQTHPGNLQHSATNAAVLDRLTRHWAFKRLSGFANGVFSTWAPRLHRFYSEHLQNLLNHDSNLERTFPNTVFAAGTFNFGKQTVCCDHIDYANLLFGWCSIWSLGSFNPQKGGHLILWDLKLVIQFPPGSLIFIPSGVCRHSNTRIRSHETRFSFTQFSAGGLFRWVDHGYQTEEKYLLSLKTRKQKDKAEKERLACWQMGIGLLSTLDELQTVA
ncbi:hypothetical protein VKT23_019889 [Stygiomarasmius scandens]|uniref:Prolyl 4-hydroxylase alpha subunit Fe(2+) 2OG dioxygenase domain-containing protein n=1 Tax=Marasmiellus scandens TaxID=2682957 RepID=A0ABR1IK70_9AGAR